MATAFQYSWGQEFIPGDSSAGTREALLCGGSEDLKVWIRGAEGKSRISRPMRSVAQIMDCTCGGRYGWQFIVMPTSFCRRC